jgi:hypothetical protein
VAAAWVSGARLAQRAADRAIRRANPSIVLALLGSGLQWFQPGGRLIISLGSAKVKGNSDNV